ncbi:MAG: DUF805 domain-containing protein [Actinomycetota bacterium]|nr:DUF805 domain-containing protein [Actinomycetota bacterium]
MGFVEAVRTCFQKYASFDGRATRSEFWWFYLFLTLVTLVVFMPGYVLMIVGAATTDRNDTPGAAFWLGIVLMIIGGLVILALYVPFLAVGCRRLHDRGQSGWLQLLLLVPCGNIVLLIFWVLEGTPGDNAYGPKPA